MVKFESYEKNAVTSMKKLSKQGIHYQIALKIVGRDELWFRTKVIRKKNDASPEVLMCDVYQDNFHKAFVQNLELLRTGKHNSAAKTLIDLGMVKHLDVKRKTNEVDRKNTDNDTTEEDLLGSL